MIKKTIHTKGFALPTILITCMALMIVILSSMSAASSLRGAIDDQYYNRLADEAAQSGVTYGVSCLSQNAFNQTWVGPLTQNEDCRGNAITPAPVIKSQANTNTTFEVGDIEGASDGAVLVKATGRVDRLVDGTTTVAKTYTSTVKRIANSAYIKFSGVKFGYYYANVSGGVNPRGVYYFVKGSDGKLRAAGSNDYGQLGNKTTDNAINPTEVLIPDGKKAAAVYTNFLSQGWNTFFKTTDGTIYGAGWNKYGQLGNNTTNEKTSELQKFDLNGETGQYVGLLGFSTYVITTAGNIYASGSCEDGQLGIGESCTSNGSYITKPTKVQGLPDVNDDKPEDEIFADAHGVFVRMQSGKVYGWGANYQGEMCNGTQGEYHQATQVGWFGNPGRPKATSIAFDGVTLYVIDSNKDLWVCGNNQWGQGGINSPADYIKTPQKVQIPGSAGGVTKVHTDQWYFMALTTSGNVYGAGNNVGGQLGDGSRINRRAPVRFNTPPGVAGVDIYETSHGDEDSGHNNNAFMVGNDGKVYGAGGNLDGQLGNGGNQEYVTTPTPMQVFGPRVRASSVQTGGGTTLIVTRKGTYYTVGDNQFGQLGNGNTLDANIPAEAKFLKPASGAFVF